MTTPQSLITTFEETGLRRAFACFPSGVTAICALVDGVPTGISASSFTSVSLVPALAAVCIAHTSTTWPTLSRVAARLGVSVLADSHSDVAASLSGKSHDRFAEVDWTATDEGAVFIQGATLWLDCEVRDAVPAGDHDIVVLSIRGLRSRPEVPPMVFHGSAFRRLGPVE